MFKKTLINIMCFIIAILILLGAIYSGMHNTLTIILNALVILLILTTIVISIIKKMHIKSLIGAILMPLFALIVINLNISFSPIAMLSLIIVFCIITYLSSILN